MSRKPKRNFARCGDQGVGASGCAGEGIVNDVLSTIGQRRWLTRVLRNPGEALVSARIALRPPLVVTMPSLDGEHKLTATATGYCSPDSDHGQPWVESWSVVDENGDEPRYRSDEEAALGAALDEALTARLDVAS
jgi:hypothetical protein